MLAISSRSPAVNLDSISGETLKELRDAAEKANG
jgi:hypothetical protein